MQPHDNSAHGERMSYRIKDVNELPAAIRARLTGRSAAPVADTPKRAKFGNVACEVNGIEFQSKWEGQRYEELLMMERQGVIHDLSLQYPFGLEVQTPTGAMVRIGAYIADFVYWRGERMFVEDAKSSITRRHPLYVLKRKMYEGEYGVRIIEVERSKPRSGAGEP
jgi:hypothetical protein